MKKIIKVFVCAVISVLIAIGTLNASAISSIDPQKSSFLTLQYKHGSSYYSGVEIKIYRIAEVFPDGTYALCDAFKDYPVSLYDVTSQTEWKSITSTLDSFVIADKIAPTYTAVTNESGTVLFSDILSGMYLTMSVKVENTSEIIVFESFLTAVPAPDANGNHNYDVTAYPKCESVTPTFKEIEYKTVKHWKDSGHTSKRPEYIEIDVIKDGVVQSTQKLSDSNNWSYIWTAQDDGSAWSVVEKNIPFGYSVTVVKNGNNLIVTNTYDGQYKNPPKTGETTVLWPWILAMCLSGGLMIILSVWRKRAVG